VSGVAVTFQCLFVLVCWQELMTAGTINLDAVQWASVANDLCMVLCPDVSVTSAHNVAWTVL
jgi:hypothetical protein